MTYHQSFAVSVAFLITAATVLVLGYRLGRTHAAWRDVRAARQAMMDSRRYAWRHTARCAMGALAVVATLLVAGWNLAR